MIDLGWAAANALWILGLAWVVAALSWRGSQSDSGWSLRWGLILVGVGLCAAREFLPERVLWGLLTLAVPVQALVAQRRRDDAGD